MKEPHIFTQSELFSTRIVGLKPKQVAVAIKMKKTNYFLDLVQFLMADGGFELGSSGSATGVFSTTLRPPLIRTDGHIIVQTEQRLPAITKMLS